MPISERLGIVSYKNNFLIKINSDADITDTFFNVFSMSFFKFINKTLMIQQNDYMRNAYIFTYQTHYTLLVNFAFQSDTSRR